MADILKSQVTESLKWSVAGNWLQRIVGVVVFTVVARNVGPDALGISAIAMACIGFGELFAKQGLGMALIQRKDPSPSTIDTAFWLTMGGAVLFLLISLTFAELLGTLFGDPRVAPVIRVLSVSFIFGALTTVPIAIQSRNFDFKSQALQSVSGTVVSALVAVPMAILGFGVWAIVAQSLTHSVVSCAVIWVRTVWRPSLRFDRHEARDLLTFGRQLIIGNMLNFVKGRGDQVMLGLVGTMSSLGLYAIATKISQLIGSLLISPVERVLMPTFAKLQDDRKRFERVLHRTLRLTAMVACACYGGAALVASEAVPLVFGKQWTGVTTVCSILLVAALVRTLTGFSYHIFLSHGHPGEQNLMQGLHVVGGLLLVWFGLRWGLTGLSVAILAGNVIFGTTAMLRASKVVKFSALKMFSAFWAPLGALVVMSGGVLGLRSWLESVGASDLALLCFLSLAGGAMYLVTIFILARSLWRECLELLSRAVPRPLRRVRV